MAAYLEDASGAPPGRAAGLLRIEDEVGASAFLAATAGSGLTVLPQAARSSLTGGAIPASDVVISVERLSEIGPVRTHPGGARVTVGAGVRLRDLQADLASRGWYFPPVPTYQEAMVGGTVSTNAGGSATFKYGVTRDWVHAVRVVLYNGDVVEIERGQHVAPRGGAFRLELSDGSASIIPVPTYDLPPLKKISAGYRASDPQDVLDLVIGSEGTLGLITEVTLDLVPLPAAVLHGVVFLRRPEEAASVVDRLRRAATSTRDGSDPGGPDIRAIESLDDRCLDLLRRYGDAARLRVAVPGAARGALLFEVELRRADAEDVVGRIEAYLERAEPVRGPIERLCALLDASGVLDTLEVALPDDDARRRALVELREAVPTRVNEILVERRRRDGGVRKVGGDLIVPFEHLSGMMSMYREVFESRGLEFAVWGHLSDGNLHPNALARSAAEVAVAEDAMLQFADRAVRLGGSPLSEHGVGRSRLKQAMLARFLGDDAIAEMREVKRGFDPEWRFAPGVLFPAPDSPAQRRRRNPVDLT